MANVEVTGAARLNAQRPESEANGFDRRIELIAQSPKAGAGGTATIVFHPCFIRKYSFLF